MSNAVKAWSWSRLQCYEECPAKFKYRFIDKVDEGPKAPAMQRGIDIHKECEDYLLGKEGMSEAMHSFEVLFGDVKEMEPIVEQQWAFTDKWFSCGWFAKGPAPAWVRVIPDAVVLYDDGEAEVIDFKTGKKYGDNVEQLELFANATFCRYSDIHTVNVRLWYLDSGDEVVHTVKRKGLKARLKEWEDRVQPMFKDERFVAKPSKKCNWCKFSTVEGGPCRY